MEQLHQYANRLEAIKNNLQLIPHHLLRSALAWIAGGCREDDPLIQPEKLTPEEDAMLDSAVEQVFKF